MSHLSKRKLQNASKHMQDGGAILVACGSFSPVTMFHLLLLEIAKDWLEQHTPWFVCGGYLSPVSDAYGKPGLASATHRLEMCRRAVESSPWIDVCELEILRDEFTPTYEVIRSIRADASISLGHPVEVFLVCGEDLVRSMERWIPENVARVFDAGRLLVMPRRSSGTADATTELDQVEVLLPYKSKIQVLDNALASEVSASEIRRRVASNRSIRYLTPDAVVDYIAEHGLFASPPTASRDNANSYWAKHSRS